MSERERRDTVSKQDFPGITVYVYARGKQNRKSQRYEYHNSRYLPSLPSVSLLPRVANVWVALVSHKRHEDEERNHNHAHDRQSDSHCSVKEPWMEKLTTIPNVDRTQGILSEYNNYYTRDCKKECHVTTPEIYTGIFSRGGGR